MKFDYTMDQCDVADKTSLNSFREKLLKWHGWLFSDPDSAIWKQIYKMMWYETLFWTINKARQFADQSPSPDVGFNDAVTRFIDNGYVSMQLLAVRRLTDRAKDTVSLPRLIGDLKANSALFTRENFVSHDGLPFDPEPKRNEFYNSILAEEKPRTRWMETTGPDAWDSAERAHTTFDRLMGKKPATRRRDDSIAPEIFDSLMDHLSVCDAARLVASKFIAHTLDKNEIEKIPKEERNITFDKLAECQKAICQVAAYISAPILYAGTSDVVPTPQYDLFENWDKRWCQDKTKSELGRFFKDHKSQIDDWVSVKSMGALGLP